MKIALVRPNYYTHLITPHLGLGYLSSFLKKHGFSVEIIDALNLGLSDEEVSSRCADADLVGINCLSDYYPEVISLSRALKRQGKTVVLGGPHPSSLPELSLEETGADFVALGEGEETLLELASALKDNQAERKITGLFSARQRDFARRGLIKDLDELPFPDWGQMDPRQYKKAPHGGVVKKFPVAPICTTRGCPFSCTFCASPSFWERKIRFRSPRNVADEIEYLVDNFQVREIHFEDDNLTLKKEHALAICEEILRRNLRICWATPNGIRADTVDMELLRLMKRSGCYQVAFGIESASNQILKNIKKETNLAVISAAVRLAHKAGLLTQGFFIFGLPGETEETIAETIRFAGKLPLDKAQFLLLDILPGSELWEKLKGQFSVNWDRRSYQEVCWVPENLSKEALGDAPARAFRSFFFNPVRMIKMAKLIKPSQLRYVFRRLRDFGVVARN
ncbi:MAG: radical SAM protein [Candidatus Omnitrophota bacterium]|nr:radical SAM protein [Candidatus Omnitrophota bacterium]